MRSAGPAVRSPRPVLAAVLAVAVVALSSCAGIPSSGPVHDAGTIGDQRDEPFTRLFANPPTNGMTQQQIVEGFLEASASFDDGHAVARKFLTEDAARSWNADAGASVYNQDTAQGGAVAYRQLTEDTIRFSAPKAGVLTAQGEFTASQPGKVVTADFKLVKVAGQWRVSTLPAGLLLTTEDLGRAYLPYDVYFPDPSRTVVVPDQILLPRGPGVQTSLVRALLAGPTPWLAKAVRSAIPAGTKLVVDSVPVHGGVVQVDLTTPAANVTRTEAEAMSAQFAWTLRQLGGITTMQLTVEGVPLRVPSVGDTQSLDLWSAFDPNGGIEDADAFGVAKGRAVVLHAGALKPVRGALGDGSTPVSVVVPAFDGTQLAALDPDRRRLLVASMTSGSKAQTVLQGTGLGAPSWDRSGTLWVVDRDRTTTAVWTVQPGAPPHRVVVQDLPDGTLRTLRLARDGVRVAALVVDAHGVGHVYVGRVERSDAGVTVAGFRLLNTGFVQSTDFAWASADGLVVLGQNKATEPVQPWQVNLYGTVGAGLGPTNGDDPMVSVTAAWTRPVLASTADGTLLWYTGIGWDSSLGTAAFPAYPG